MASGSATQETPPSSETTCREGPECQEAPHLLFKNPNRFFCICFYSWWKSVPLNGIQMLWVNTLDSLVTPTKESVMLLIFPKFIEI